MRWKMKFMLCLVTCLGLWTGLWAVTRPAGSETETDLVIHEWGTFTSLQDPDGRTVRGINNDDEPVPDFVHQHPPGLLQQGNQAFPLLGKAIPIAHRDVAMRMETPVMYFHPGPDAKPFAMDVRVDFKGGWLTEFYPKAEAVAPGVRQVPYPDNPGKTYTQVGRIQSNITGTLEWKNLTIGRAGDFPKTDEPVWLAPRRVTSAPVLAANGESEQYLFYRGVGNLPSPIQVLRDRETERLQLKRRESVEIKTLWLVDVRPDGKIAFRRLPEGAIETAGRFDASDYRRSHMKALRRNMHAALVDDGLYKDEAWAMLNTWQAAYFQSPGLRLFYLLPQSWTDRVLPLTLSRKARVSRTMVGRIELVSGKQESRIRQIAQTPKHSPITWVFQALAEKFPNETERSEAFKALMTRQKTPEQLGLELPADYGLYRSLGRFRDAMVLHYAQKAGYENLNKFTALQQIRYFVTPPEKKPGPVAEK
ncbi:MAG: hypothetical protein R3236_10205 [Phycisphaeraceae bacterium]|nr:hypothetical protein [Phycisphaeraceae bacterium]